MNSAYTWWSNKDSTMGLFFKKWDDRNQQDIWLAGDKTSRWYRVVFEMPIFLNGTTNWSEDMQRNQADKYVRKYISDASGIDGARVKKWLFGIIKNVKNGIYTYQDIFGGEPTEKDTWRNIEEAQLRQALAYVPFRSYLYAINDSISFIIACFPILFGVPLILIQFMAWIIQRLKKEKLSYLFYLTKGLFRFIFLFSIVIGVIYFFRVAIDVYHGQKIADFVSGKFFHIKTGIIVGALAFLLSFLGIWGIKVFFSLAYAEIKTIGIKIKTIINKIR